jgi:hypothetical protein
MITTLVTAVCNVVGAHSVTLTNVVVVRTSVEVSVAITVRSVVEVSNFVEVMCFVEVAVKLVEVGACFVELACFDVDA